MVAFFPKLTLPEDPSFATSIIMQISIHFLEHYHDQFLAPVFPASSAFEHSTVINHCATGLAIAQLKTAGGDHEQLHSRRSKQRIFWEPACNSLWSARVSLLFLMLSQRLRLGSRSLVGSSCYWNSVSGSTSGKGTGSKGLSSPPDGWSPYAPCSASKMLTLLKSGGGAGTFWRPVCGIRDLDRLLPEFSSVSNSS